jgi:hypothetical protein
VLHITPEVSLTLTLDLVPSRLTRNRTTPETVLPVGCEEPGLLELPLQFLEPIGFAEEIPATDPTCLSGEGPIIYLSYGAVYDIGPVPKPITFMFNDVECSVGLYGDGLDGHFDVTIYPLAFNPIQTLSRSWGRLKVLYR